MKLKEAIQLVQNHGFTHIDKYHSFVVLRHRNYANVGDCIFEVNFKEGVVKYDYTLNGKTYKKEVKDLETIKFFVNVVLNRYPELKNSCDIFIQEATKKYTSLSKKIYAFLFMDVSSLFHHKEKVIEEKNSSERNLNKLRQLSIKGSWAVEKEFKLARDFTIYFFENHKDKETIYYRIGNDYIPNFVEKWNKLKSSSREKHEEQAIHFFRSYSLFFEQESRRIKSVAEEELFQESSISLKMLENF